MREPVIAKSFGLVCMVSVLSTWNTLPFVVKMALIWAVWRLGKTRLICAASKMRSAVKKAVLIYWLAII